MLDMAAATAASREAVNVGQGHGRRGRLIYYLRGSVGNVDKTAPDVGEFLFYVVEDAVHNMVADVGSRAVGENGRVTGVFDGLHHSFYGKIRKIGGGGRREKSARRWAGFPRYPGSGRR